MDKINDGYVIIRMSRTARHQLRIIGGVYDDPTVSATIERIMVDWLIDHPEVPRVIPAGP